MEQEIEQLKKDVAELKAWKAQRIAQQVTYPLDRNSIIILNKYFMRLTDVIQYEVVGASSHLITNYIGQQGSEEVSGASSNLQFNISPNTYFSYTVNTTLDTITTAGGNFTNDTDVLLYTNDTYPSPFAVNTIYYVVNATSRTSFQLALTPGGSAINITTLGVGQQYITYNL